MFSFLLRQIHCNNPDSFRAKKINLKNGCVHCRREDSFVESDFHHLQTDTVQHSESPPFNWSFLSWIVATTLSYGAESYLWTAQGKIHQRDQNDSSKMKLNDFSWGKSKLWQSRGWRHYKDSQTKGSCGSVVESLFLNWKVVGLIPALAVTCQSVLEPPKVAPTVGQWCVDWFECVS